MKIVLSVFIAIVSMCGILLGFPALTLAENNISSDSTLSVIENEIKYDFIPDNLSTDTQRHITREEYCTTIVSLYQYISKSSVALPASNPFTDTNNPAVLQAYHLGIVKGQGQGKFNPQQKLTIEEKATMLYNTLLKLDPSIDDDIKHNCDFSDADKISSWAVEAIEYLYHHNIISDDDNNNINPKGTVTIEKSNLSAQNTAKHHKTTLASKAPGDNSPLVTCTAYGTKIAVPDGDKKIEMFNVGDQVLAADMSLNWSPTKISFSSGTGASSQQSTMVYIHFGDNDIMIVTPDQLFMLSDRKLKRADRLIAGKDNLVDQNGKPVAINNIAIGRYKGGIHHISTSLNYNGSPDGHLLLAEGVVIGDFTLQINARELDEYMADRGQQATPIIN